MTNETKCGFVALIGQPNVGKSTLLNQLLGQKISITSRKAQTTRHRITGIQTKGAIQTIYVDTPGIYSPDQKQQRIDHIMHRTTHQAISDVDVIVLMMDVHAPLSRNEDILSLLSESSIPVILALNKVDLLPDKKLLLPLINELTKIMPKAEIIPLSVIKNVNIDRLEQCVQDKLPESPFLFDAKTVTDRNEHFLAAEVIREKILLYTHKEVPHRSTVTIDSFKKQNKTLHIYATVWVERKGQKAILIGKAGEQLKMIGTRARLELEQLFKQPVFLSIWVKVKTDWTNDDAALKTFGIQEDS